jgi:hypothetical protein
MMRTHMEFPSDAFPRESGEEEADNLGRWGAALARVPRQELPNRGLPRPDPIAKNWGYCITIDNQAFDPWVGCGLPRTLKRRPARPEVEAAISSN